MPFVNQHTLAKKWQFLLCSRPWFLASSGISKLDRQLSTAHIVHTWSKYHLSWQITYDTFVQEKQEKKKKKKVKLQGRSGALWWGGLLAGGNNKRQSQIWLIQNIHESTCHPLVAGVTEGQRRAVGRPTSAGRTALVPCSWTHWLSMQETFAASIPRKLFRGLHLHCMNLQHARGGTTASWPGLCRMVSPGTIWVSDPPCNMNIKYYCWLLKCLWKMVALLGK